MKVFEIRLFRQNIKRKPGSLFFFVVFFSAFICLSLIRHSARRQESLRIAKRNTGEELPPDDKEELPPPDETENPPHDDPAGFEPLPGTLICEPAREPPKAAVDGEPARAVPVAPPRSVVPAVLEVETVRQLPLVNGWSPPKQKIGCCPPGSRTGTVYFKGYSCCVDIVYNATAQFCCLEKARVLDINPDNVEFCYPIDRPPFCRESDLNVLPPQTLECEFANKEKTPTTCDFKCPPGSQVRGSKSATCTPVGTWDLQPQCCEGCPPTTKMDIWFVVDVDSGVGVAGLGAVRTFIKNLLSYLPVSQGAVRVALTAFSRSLFEEISWPLTAINTHQELNTAVNAITSNDLGRYTGAALEWVSQNAFVESNGDRADSENVVVLVTTGNPEDDIAEAARQVRAVGRLIVIAIGPDATAVELANIPSEATESNFLRVLRFNDLDQKKKFLYTTLCGENCLTTKIR